MGKSDLDLQFFFVQIFKILMFANIKPVLYFQTPAKPDVLQNSFARSMMKLFPRKLARTTIGLFLSGKTGQLIGIKMLAKALEPGFPIPLNITDIKDFTLLDYWLQRSQPYPGNTLIQISSALQRHLRANSIFKDVNFFKTDDSTFAKMGKKCNRCLTIIFSKMRRDC